VASTEPSSVVPWSLAFKLMSWISTVPETCRRADRRDVSTVNQRPHSGSDKQYDANMHPLILVY
jgi:hypothetical protein